VREIAERGASLYDKLVGFVEDLTDIGNRLRQASQSYESATNNLVQGQGSVIRQAEMLRDLGVKPSKSLPKKLVESALAEQPFVFPALAVVREADGLEGDPPADDTNPESEEDIAM